MNQAWDDGIRGKQNAEVTSSTVADILLLGSLSGPHWTLVSVTDGHTIKVLGKAPELNIKPA